MIAEIIDGLLLQYDAQKVSFCNSIELLPCAKLNCTLFALSLFLTYIFHSNSISFPLKKK